MNEYLKCFGSHCYGIIINIYIVARQCCFKLTSNTKSHYSGYAIIMAGHIIKGVIIFSHGCHYTIQRISDN